jgi:hypothetical protein
MQRGRQLYLRMVPVRKSIPIIRTENNKWTWEDLFLFQVLGILTVNLIEGIRWGADWNGKNLWFDERFRDFCHYEVKK